MSVPMSFDVVYPSRHLYSQATMGTLHVTFGHFQDIRSKVFANRGLFLNDIHDMKPCHVRNEISDAQGSVSYFFVSEQC